MPLAVITILVYSVSDNSTVNIAPEPCLASPPIVFAVLPFIAEPVVVYVKIEPLASTLAIVPTISFAGDVPPNPA